MKIDLYACLDAAYEDGYDKLKAKLGGCEYDLDFQELAEQGCTVWQTNFHGNISLSLEIGNVLTVTVQDNYDRSGTISTYDFDSYGFASCVMSALWDYWKDCKETLIDDGIARPIGECKVTKCVF